MVDKVDDHINDNERASPSNTSRAVNHYGANVIITAPVLLEVDILKVAQHSTWTTHSLY